MTVLRKTKTTASNVSKTNKEKKTQSNKESISNYIKEINRRFEYTNQHIPRQEIIEINKLGIKTVPVQRKINSKTNKYYKHCNYPQWQKIGESDAYFEIFSQLISSPSNYGILTGNYVEGKGYLSVIDIDTKENGIENFSMLLDRVGLNFNSLKDTLMCATQSNGLHMYLFTKKKIPQKQGLQGIHSGIDTRSSGGMVIGGGSVMGGDSASYKFNQKESFNILECPEILENYLLYKLRNEESTDIKVASGYRNTKSKKNKIHNMLPEDVEEGKRHHYLISLAGSLVNIFDNKDDFANEIYKANEKLLTPKTNEKEINDIIDYAWGDKQKTPSKKHIKSYYVKRVKSQEHKNGKIVKLQNYEKIFYESLQDNQDFLLPFKHGHIITFAQSIDEKPILIGRLKNTYRIIEDGTALINFLSNFYVVDFPSNNHLTFSITSKRYYDYLLQTAVLNGNIYNNVSLLPEYLPEKDTLYLCPPIEPRYNGSFEELMNLFTFKTKQDKYNFAAAILSTFLNKDWIRNIPLLMMRAAGKSAGKTYLPQKMSELLQGHTAILLKGTDSDKEAYYSLGTFGNKFSLYDNLAFTDRKVLNQITINCTSQTLDMHIMNVKHGKTPNNKLHIITINSDSSVNDDIIERAMPCHLADHVKEEQRLDIDSRIMELLKDNEYRKKLHEDILFHIKKGMNSSVDLKVKYPPKVGLWATKMAQVVYQIFKGEIKEGDVLDFSAQESDREMSAEYSMDKDFIAGILAKSGFSTRDVFMTNISLLDMLQGPHKSGKYLKIVTDRCNKMFNGKVRFEKSKKNNERGYYITARDPEFFKN